MKIMYIRLSDEVHVTLTKQDLKKAFKSENSMDEFTEQIQVMANTYKRTPFTRVVISIEKEGGEGDI